MEDLDMDIEIDYGEGDIDPEVERLNADVRAMEEAAAKTRAVQDTQDVTMDGVDAAVEDGEVQDIDIQPHKIYFSCGNEMFSPDDVKSYVSTYFDINLLEDLDWINDYSVNLVFDTEATALNALAAMTPSPIGDHLKIRNGKPHPDPRFSSYDISLRQAKVTDVKVRGAHRGSRYYLLNPEADPENRYRNGGRSDRRGRRGGPRPYNDYDRQGGRPRRGYRGDDQPTPAAFDESMYDDRAAPPARDITRRDSISSDDSSYGRKQIVYEEGRLRDRSASPMRGGDGRYGFEADQPRRQTARYRSRSPPRRRERAGNRNARDLFEKDLFANRAKNRSYLSHNDSNGHRNEAPRELFPDRIISSPGHRRKDAHSLHPNEVVTAIGHDSYRRSSTDYTHRPSSRDHDRPNSRDSYRPTSRDSYRPSGDLMDRITRGGQSSDFGRLHSDDDEIKFKGAASGFRSSTRPSNKARELFPHKTRSSHDDKPKDLMDLINKKRDRAEDYS